MPALDFPTSPTNGQFYQGYVWNAANSTWDSSYQADALKPGLTQIIAPTVSISGGTATANSLGTISFTSATGVMLNNVFTSAYKNYRIVVTCAASTGCEIAIRYANNGTADSSSSYKAGGWRFASNVTDNYSMGGGTYHPLGLINSAQTNNFSASFDIYNPAVTGNTNMGGVSNGYGGTYATGLVYAGQWLGDATFNGLYLYPTAGNFTGAVQILGYPN